MSVPSKPKPTSLQLMEDVVVSVPDKDDISWIFLGAVVFVSTGMVLARMVVFASNDPLACLMLSFSSAMMLFCALWYPYQILKQRRDAIRINAWNPELEE